MATDNDILKQLRHNNIMPIHDYGRGSLQPRPPDRNPWRSGRFWLLFLAIFLPAFLCTSTIAITLLNRWTMPPSPPPIIQSPVPTPTVTPTPAQQAQEVVQQYYNDWNRRDYHAAYSLLGIEYQKLYPYGSLVGSYENTESSQITINNVTQLPNDTFRIIVTDHATEKDVSGGTVKRVYRVTYTVGQEKGSWKILNVSVQVIG